MTFISGAGLIAAVHAVIIVGGVVLAAGIVVLFGALIAGCSGMLAWPGLSGARPVSTTRRAGTKARGKRI